MTLVNYFGCASAWFSQKSAGISAPFILTEVVQLSRVCRRPCLHVPMKCTRADQVWQQGFCLPLQPSGGVESLRLLRVSQRLLAWEAPHLSILGAVWFPSNHNQMVKMVFFLTRPPPEVIETLSGGKGDDLARSGRNNQFVLMESTRWFSWTERDGLLEQDDRLGLATQPQQSPALGLAADSRSHFNKVHQFD